MKKLLFFAAVLTVAGFAACNKSNSDVTSTSLTASTTTASVGQTVSVQATTATNAVSWSVTPSASVSKQYSITTAKTNAFTFSQAGQYVIGVRARNIDYDSSRHQDIDSCWRAGGGDRGNCTHGKDSASLVITVK